MGTVFEVVVYGLPMDRASAAIDKALDEAVRLDDVMSNYKDNSDLSRMNRSAHFQAMQIPLDLYRVIEESLPYSRLSRGRFDISVGPLVDLWKAAMQGGPMPTKEEQAKAKDCVGYQKIELTPPNRIELHSTCMRLDLGSIGKGYAVDRMAEILRAEDVRNAYINAGGSTILGIGTPPGQKGWTVHLRKASDNLDLAVILIDNSLSTSEQTAASSINGDSPGHIVLPANGKPLQTKYAVNVVARSATESDALSTTLLLVGPQSGSAMVKELKDVAAMWISRDGDRTVVDNGPHIFGENHSHTTADGKSVGSKMSTNPNQK
jgi:Membrane-associated lipoprotein involved in thiamine biosynthesis